MKKNICVDWHYAKSFLTKEELQKMEALVVEQIRKIHDKSGAGSEFLGWVNLPSSTTRKELQEIQALASRIRKRSDVLVLIGIGGSYLGARAVIEALGHQFSALLNKSRRKNTIVLYAGHNLSGKYLEELLQVLDKKHYSIICVSKSGTTTEPAIAFRIIRSHLEKKYGKKNARKRIAVITDKSKGALLHLSEKEKYPRLLIPDDVGGRYSVFTPVGLLPVAVAGFDILDMIRGARDMESLCIKEKIFDNPAALYAALRFLLHEKGKNIEILVSYQPSLFYIMEWWKQLFGESEGKENTGIFPASMSNTTDLHSLGQYMQQGKRFLFESILSVEKEYEGGFVPDDQDDLDALNYLRGKSCDYICTMAEKGTTEAHVEGAVPCLKINIPEINEYYIGQLLYLFEKACAISAYLFGLNPFDQPGVEAYKKKMFMLLGKPG
jgi:glucose-6-phosphate isomerase